MNALCLDIGSGNIGCKIALHGSATFRERALEIVRLDGPLFGAGNPADADTLFYLSNDSATSARVMKEKCPGLPGHFYLKQMLKGTSDWPELCR